MPLKKIALKSGVNRENTRYASEGVGMSATKYGSDKAPQRK
jgi:hypothetical protein